MAGDKQQQMIRPSQTHQAQIFLHPLPETGPLVMKLSDPMLELLQRIDMLQRVQAGEDIAPENEAGARPLDKTVAAEVEACIDGALREIARCSWGRRENVRKLSWEEDEAIERARAEVERLGITPASDENPEAAKKRRAIVAAQLEAIVR